MTLPDSDSSFTMGGMVLVHAVVDTEAGKVMISARMAMRMRITEDNLEPRESYIVATGTLEAPRS